MTSRIAKSAVVLLLGFVLAWQGVVSVSTGVSPNAGATKSSCCCSGCDSRHCSTPACCARPADDHTPYPPAPPPTSPQNERQALAASVSSWWKLPFVSPAGPP